jgi:hypothetical protein
VRIAQSSRALTPLLAAVVSSAAWEHFRAINNTPIWKSTKKEQRTRPTQAKSVKYLSFGREFNRPSKAVAVQDVVLAPRARQFGSREITEEGDRPDLKLPYFTLLLYYFTTEYLLHSSQEELQTDPAASTSGNITFLAIPFPSRRIPCHCVARSDITA